MKLSIRHITTYRYRYPVVFSPHRICLRPREGQDISLLRHEIISTPIAKTNWATDVYGNAIAIATFTEPADTLEIDSRAEVDLRSVAWPVFDIVASAIDYPFLYEEQVWNDLGTLRNVQYPDPVGQFQQWVRAFIMASSTDTLSLLKDINIGVFNAITYRVREAEGTQSPLETLEARSGSCRDLAVLFAEAVRLLGFGARIVSGYIFDPDRSLIGASNSGTTHAWVDVFLPGAGWITFDPTNRSLGSVNLIPVAAVRDIKQAMPISGGFIGAAKAFLSMDVTVDISVCN